MARAVALKQPPKSRRSDLVHGVVLARLHTVGQDGVARVAPWGAPASTLIDARMAAALTAIDAGSEVAVVFERGDVNRPIVIGKIERFPTQGETNTELTKTARLDGETVVLEAGKEIVLRCGEATITLTREGKILIHGAYVSSRSRGLNRIRGGSVQIN